MNTMTRAIQAVPRSRLSSEMEHRWGEHSSKKCKNCVPKGGIRGGRRPVAPATARRHHPHLQPGQGKGRFRCYSGVETFPPFPVQNTCLLPAAQHALPCAALPALPPTRGPGSSPGSWELPVSPGTGHQWHGHGTKAGCAIVGNLGGNHRTVCVEGSFPASPVPPLP